MARLDALAKLLECLLAGQFLGLVGEAVPGGFLLDENLQVESPGFFAIQQAYRDGIEIVGFEAVVQMCAAPATKPRWAQSEES